MSGDDFLAAYAARDWARAVAMVEDGWTDLVFSHATYRAVFALLGEAPEDELRRRPRCALMAESVGRFPRGSVPVRLPTDPTQVDHAVRAGHARDLVELAILAMIARRAVGLPHDALAIARSSRPLLRAASLTRFSPAADLAAYWHLQAAQAALHAGEPEQARRDVEHAWTFRGNDVTGYVAPSSAPLGVLLAALAGDTDGERRWRDEVDALAPAGRDLIEWETMERPAVVASLLGASDRGEAETAGRLVESLLPQLAFDELWPITLAAIVRHLVDTGAVERAEQLVATTVDRHPAAPRSGSFHGDYATVARAEVARAAGRVGVLQRVLADEGPRPGLAALHPVHLALLTDDLPAARRLAATTEHAATDDRVRRESRLVGTALADGPAGDRTQLPPALRRTAALLPAEVNARLSASYDGVPVAVGVPRGAPAVRLTPAESRVLHALGEEVPLPEVAVRLHVSRNTLKTQLRGLYAKLGVSSRAEALATAGRMGLLGDDEGPPP